MWGILLNGFPVNVFGHFLFSGKRKRAGENREDERICQIYYRDRGQIYGSAERRAKKNPSEKKGVQTGISFPVVWNDSLLSAAKIEAAEKVSWRGLTFFILRYEARRGDWRRYAMSRPETAEAGGATFLRRYCETHYTAFSVK